MIGPEAETDSESSIYVNTRNERFRSTKRRPLSRPNQIVFGPGSLMRESRSFIKSFSPRRSRHRSSIRIRGLFEDLSNGYLSSLLEN